MTTARDSGIIVAMDHDAPLETILLRIAAMPQQERAETLLGYFVRLIESMDRPTLAAFRAVCVSSIPLSTQKDTLIEVIDGQLALRQINEGSTAPHAMGH